MCKPKVGGEYSEAAGGGKVWLEDEGVAKQVDLDEVLHARRAPRDPSKVPVMTMKEVEASAKQGEAFIVIKGKVYDVKKFAKRHPGGVGPLFHGAGKDMTDQFSQFHSLETWKRLAFFHKANVVEEDTKKRDGEALQRDWDALAQQVLAEGLYQTDYWFYVKEVLRCFAILTLAVALTLGALGDSWLMHMLGAVALGIAWQQMAFLGHDLGHNGITHNAQLDARLGFLFGNVLTGIDIYWWKDSHNNHHICCNSIDGDADIQHMPFVACNPKIVSKPFWSSYHNVIFNATEPLTRALLSIQHWLYYPAILGFARYNLYAQSFIHIFKGRARKPLFELFCLGLFWAWFVTLVTTLPTVGERVLFVAVCNGVAGILNIQITLSHFCMEVYYGSPYSHSEGVEGGWMHTQLKTTLALVCPPYMDWFHGGLQFQDVHHLLPRVPRHNLRQLRPRIKALCRKHGIGDLSPEVGFLEANLMTMRLLRQAADKVSNMKFISPDVVTTSPLWETLNAQG